MNRALSDLLDLAVRLVAAGMSQSDAAREMGLPQTTVSTHCRRAGIFLGRGHRPRRST